MTDPSPDLACEQHELIGNTPEWWRVPHLARHYSLGEATIQTAIRSGELPAHQMGPKTIVVRLTDAQRWFDERSQPVANRSEVGA